MHELEIVYKLIKLMMLLKIINPKSMTLSFINAPSTNDSLLLALSWITMCIHNIWSSVLSFGIIDVL